MADCKYCGRPATREIRLQADEYTPVCEEDFYARLYIIHGWRYIEGEEQSKLAIPMSEKEQGVSE